jgi:predicted XRE-type DNA-binding protein
MKKTNKNIFKDIGFSDPDSASLEARARLMIILEKEVRRLNITQAEIAAELGVKPPRVSELLNGKINKFSLDLLIIYLARLGKIVEFTLHRAA